MQAGTGVMPARQEFLFAKENNIPLIGDWIIKAI